MTFPVARWWHLEESGRVVCELCPRSCTLVEGQEGYCGVRVNDDGSLRTTVSGFTSGFAVDPIEKKPLYHFLPGTDVLSFGTVGCNMGCTFCQNWSLSQAEDFSRLKASDPESIVQAARAHHCAGVAFTYNEPIISAEFCLEVAQACHAAGLKTIAVTAGYIAEPAREAFFQHMDAANVDLKGFSDAFYRHYCGASLEPVLETLEYLALKTSVWVELTTLLIPEANDSPDELRALASWVVEHLGQEVPLHFSAFHPDHRLLDRRSTPLSTLQAARSIARENGLSFVYLGNVRSADGSTTFCPGCGKAVITRDGYAVSARHLVEGKCAFCSALIPGRFST
jgi:pyruvate formate lyase activating enzyme